MRRASLDRVRGRPFDQATNGQRRKIDLHQLRMQAGQARPRRRHAGRRGSMSSRKGTLAAAQRALARRYGSASWRASGPSSSAASLRAADECNTIDRTTIISLRGRRRTRHPGASRARAFGGNPYFFLSRRPFREEHLRAYVVRQHRNGRKVADILSDAYVRRLGSERFCWKVIEDPSTIEALERNVREAFADPHF
jgi:hypothetical protein